MMKRALALLQFNRHRLKLRFLFIAQDTFDRVHVIRQAGDRQKVPGMTAGDVMHTTVLARGIVKPDPARQVRYRPGARPVGIVLMPGYDATVSGRFAEKLIVPENKSDRPRRGAVINAFRDGARSASNDPLLKGVPPIPAGEKMDGQFFPLLFEDAEG